MIGLTEFLYPFPQTAGKERNVLLVEPSIFEGMTFRPTANEAQSLQFAPADRGYSSDRYVLPTALQDNFEKNRDAESLAKAQTVGGSIEKAFTSIADLIGKAFESARTWNSIADQFVAEWNLVPQSTTQGSPVPGRPVSPTIVDYTSRDFEAAMKEKLIQLEAAGKSFLSQVKGLFNIAYPPSTNGTVSVAQAQSQPMSPLLIIGIIVIVYLVLR